MKSSLRPEAQQPVQQQQRNCSSSIHGVRSFRPPVTSHSQTKCSSWQRLPKKSWDKLTFGSTMRECLRSQKLLWQTLMSGTYSKLLAQTCLAHYLAVRLQYSSCLHRLQVPAVSVSRCHHTQVTTRCHLWHCYQLPAQRYQALGLT